MHNACHVVRDVRELLKLTPISHGALATPCLTVPVVRAVVRVRMIVRMVVLTRKY